MAQLSRPFQIALVAVALLAAVWLLALRGHSSGGGGESAPTPAPKASTSTSPGSPSTPYKGSAPGVAGLTRAIQKAHGAVAQSERKAKQLDEKSRQVSSSGGPEAKSSGSARPTRSTSTAAAPGASTKSASQRHSAAARHVTRHHVSTRAVSTSGLPAHQAMVERELKRGFTAAILFWSPAAPDDAAVRSALRQLLGAQQHKASARSAGRELGDGSVVLEPRGGEERIALHESSAGQVASYGSFTRAVQVYQTPTLLLVNPHGQATVLTGFTDAFSIEQALDEPQA